MAIHLAATVDACGRGDLIGEDLLAKEGEKQWVRADTLPLLFAQASPPRTSPKSKPEHTTVNPLVRADPSPRSTPLHGSSLLFAVSAQRCFSASRCVGMVLDPRRHA